MRYLILPILLILSYCSITAQTAYVSITTGAWDEPSTWDQPNAPKLTGAGADEFSEHAIISGGTTVTVGGGLKPLIGSLVTIEDGGTLIITSNVVFDLGCVFNVLEGGTLTVNGSGTNSIGSEEVTINGTVTIGTNFFGLPASIINGIGSISITGNLEVDGTIFGSDGDCAGGCTTSGAYPLDATGDFRANGADPDLSNTAAWASQRK